MQRKTFDQTPLAAPRNASDIMKCRIVQFLLGYGTHQIIIVEWATCIQKLVKKRQRYTHNVGLYIQLYIDSPFYAFYIS